MTAVTLNLPDDLANDVQKFGTLESAEFLQFIEKLTNKFKQQQEKTITQDKPVINILDRLSAPELETQGLSDIDFDIPKANINLKQVEF